MNEWSVSLAIILGIVEGLTEFLPVSSTGHLILVGHALGFTGETAAHAEISIQLGAILAVIVYERAKLRSLISNAQAEQTALVRSIRSQSAMDTWAALLRQSLSAHPHLWFLIGLGVAFVPAGLVGFVTHDWIKSHLFSPLTVAITSIIGGVIILIVEGLPNRTRVVRLEQVGLRYAVLIGLAQCASLIPGMSRSGSTIIGGLLAGLDRKVATEYSFFLALPTLIVATGYQLLKSRGLFGPDDYMALAIGLIVSFLTAWIVIAAFLTFVKRHTLRPFAYYRILMGLIVLYIFGL
ncbi:Undecaprenyl-diphosphatase [Nitrospira sp. KM1]|uniref:undecaprenyl-diphosphate phosphatase n=1 Tax=Nitrospira sp. KM1 TaxID=1936990 RepID=UPI0013A727E8|nr:undecaprenyl-diphosphate phosphatase [Nitrospira sp. KM1]BCA56206.1 Undecaprenyl-diphosphatase [Nitrospira sp. KM1]